VISNSIKISIITIALLCLIIPLKTKSASDDIKIMLNVGEFCGDNIINGAEQCDDGNNNNGDGCSAVCVLEFCGDGVVNNNTEICDSNTEACVTASGYNGNWLCNLTCDGWNACIATESCGDGIVNGNETCDDGNNFNCDGCRSDCTRMDNICGDGYYECAEECDGANGVLSGFRCTDQCLQVKVGGSSIIPEMFDPIVIYQIFVRLSSSEAVINWVTNKNAWCALEWGENFDIQNEKIQELSKNREHRAILNNLHSDTNYYYKISCHDSWGHHRETEIRSFKTLTKEDNKPPANVENFRAIPLDKTINLFWNNPKDPDLQAVKILRREDRFPESINDGLAVYNDKKENFTDINVKNGRNYYYTAYAYDNNSNYSSGAIASAHFFLSTDKSKEGKKDGDLVFFKDNDTTLGLPFRPKIDKGKPVLPEFKLNMQDLLISAASETVNFNFLQNKIISLPGTIMRFKLPADKTPKTLKTIILSIVPIENNYSANNYLLRIDKDEKFYTAELNLPLKIGDYQLLLTLLDYQDQKIYKTKADLEIQKFGQVSYYNSSVKKYLPVSKAYISLYSLENEQFVKWPGQKFSQFNPMMSNAIGQYGFIAPNGRYLIKAQKDGFYPYTSPVYKISNNIINENLEMVIKPYFNWPLFVLEMIIGLLAYLALRVLFISVKKSFF